MVSPKRVSLVFTLSTLLVVSIYRLQLTLGLFKNPVKPFDYHPTMDSFPFILSLLLYDFPLLLFGFLLSWTISSLWMRGSRRKGGWILIGLGLIFIHVLLVSFILIHGAHIRLLFEAQTGLSLWILREVFLNVPFTELLRFIHLRDLPFLVVPFFVFWALFFSPFSVWRWVRGISLGGMVLLFMGSLVVFLLPLQKPVSPLEIRLNPVFFLLYDLLKEEGQISHLNERRKEIQKKSTFMIQEKGAESSFKPVRFFPPRKEHPWNIVIFVMESVGTRYIFDQREGKPMPMPFFYHLTKEGWYLKRHFTTSNISTKALFSILSGLYDFFRQENFGTRSDATVPSLQKFLGEGYDAFLVTPSPIPWYFPEAFVRNNGLKEIYHFGNLNFKIREAKHAMGRYLGRDEVETFDFFIQRVKKGKEPFLGIYISFVAHLPYFDYGETFRIRELDGKMINRYYNNLYLLDRLIKKMVEALKETGLLERTILVILGDHGQAFGQHHPDNFMHHRYSYNENLETPAFLYQPVLFPPREIEFPTSHIDLLPTLLESLGISHDPSLFDGESLFQTHLKRNYLYFYGHEGTLSSLNSHLIKVQYSYKKNQCWVFDLKADPEEQFPLSCDLFTDQWEDLQYFAHTHNEKLLKYNKFVKERKKATLNATQLHRP